MKTTKAPEPETTTVAPDARPMKRTTEHFTLTWDAAQTSDEEVEAVAVRAEQGFSAVSRVLGSRVPTTAPKLVIVLEGDGVTKDGGFRGIPHVSLETGALHLFRFPGQGGDYTASLVHELVHALRIDLIRAQLDSYGRGFGFIEEGFAELVATEAGLPSEGFPTYGVPIDVVAGQWSRSQEELPLTELFSRHGELNQRCFMQAYSERASFFAFLKARHGFEPVLQWAYAKDALDDARFKALFSTSRNAAFDEWSAWAKVRFEALSDGAQRADTYRTQTPAKHFPVCRPSDIAANASSTGAP